MREWPKRYSVDRAMRNKACGFSPASSVFFV